MKTRVDLLRNSLLRFEYESVAFGHACLIHSYEFYKSQINSAQLCVVQQLKLSSFTPFPFSP